MDNFMKANDGKGTKADQGIITICKEHFEELRNTNTTIALKVRVVTRWKEALKDLNTIIGQRKKKLEQ